MADQNKVQWVYSARNNQELAERYDQWAGDYDSDLGQDFGWLGPERAAQVFSSHVPKETRVLDAGAGTGLVGQILSRMGYSDLVAMDLSQGMLDESLKKGVYREFHQMVMGEPAGLRHRCLWRRNQRGSAHRRPCPGPFAGRVNPRNQVRRTRCVQPAARRMGGRRVSRDADRA